MDFEPVGAAPLRSFKLATAELANAHHAALCRRNQDQVRLPKYVFAILPGRVEILQ
jgi:hypothetical protein